MVRILHAADFHLDSAFTGLNEQQARQRRQESRDLTRRMVEYANDHGVQLMLLAGDLFDSDSIYGQTAEKLAAALAEFRGHVVIAPGNHDCYTAASPYVAILKRKKSNKRSSKRCEPREILIVKQHITFATR